MRDRITIENICYYVQGNIRYRLYYSWFRWLLREHIREQIIFRINSMNRVCYDRGSCIVCGCVTTQLQMSDKVCAGNCYPKMFTKKEWESLKRRECMYIVDNQYWSVDNKKHKFIRYELEKC